MRAGGIIICPHTTYQMKSAPLPQSNLSKHQIVTHPKNNKVKTMQTKKIKHVITILIAVIAASALVILTPWIIIKINPDFGIYAGSAAGFIIFILILEYQSQRFIKGMSLIAFGVLFQVLYTKYYFLFIDADNPQLEDLKTQLNLYMQVLLLACAGAGGSIVAVYADKNSSDYEHTSPNQTLIDNTQHIEKLIINTQSIQKKITIAIYTFILTTVAISIIAIILLLK